MSFVGKLTRGLKWDAYSDRNGNIPASIANDPAKMCDVLFYREFLKGKDENKVKVSLAKMRALARHGQKRGNVYAAEAAKIGLKKVKLTATDGSGIERFEPVKEEPKIEEPKKKKRK